MTKKQKKILIRIILSAFIIFLAVIIPLNEYERIALLISAYLLIGYDIIRKALKGIFRGQAFVENFLLAVAIAILQN